jgi:hypothetical protein
LLIAMEFRSLCWGLGLAWPCRLVSDGPVHQRCRWATGLGAQDATLRSDLQVVSMNKRHGLWRSMLLTEFCRFLGSV